MHQRRGGGPDRGGLGGVAVTGDGIVYGAYGAYTTTKGRLDGY